MGEHFGGTHGAAGAGGILATCKKVFDCSNACLRHGLGRPVCACSHTDRVIDGWSTDTADRFVWPRGTAAFLQMLHSTASAVGSGRRESFSCGVFAFQRGARLRGHVHDPQGLGQSYGLD